MKTEDIKKEIEKLKKYNILKTNRCQIDTLLNEEEKINKAYQEGNRQLQEQRKNTNPLKERLTKITDQQNDYKKKHLKKIFSFFKYKKQIKEYKEVKKQVEEMENKEKELINKIKKLEEKQEEIAEKRKKLCGFSFTKEYYNTFLEEFREKAYYNRNLKERIANLEKELHKQEK